MYNAYDKKMEKGTMNKLNGVHIDLIILSSLDSILFVAII